MRVVWLGGKRERYDAFPAVSTEMGIEIREKGYGAMGRFVQHLSVDYTGDKPLELYDDGSRGNDVLIFASRISLALM